MMPEQEIVHILYKKLLNLYPREFREELGESMQQTFTDLYKGRRTGSVWFGFVPWIFAETGMGIFREYVLFIAEGTAMKSMLANPRSAPLTSFMLCVLPFMILEWATRSDAPRSDASPLLWIVLWLLSTGFVAVLMLIVRNLRREGNSIIVNPVSLIFRLVFLVLFAWLWGALVIDQMPCFLGGSGC